VGNSISRKRGYVMHALLGQKEARAGMFRSLTVTILVLLISGCASIDKDYNNVHIKSFGITRYNKTLSFGYLNIKEVTIENTDTYTCYDKPVCGVCGK
jgi:hypothetical protein